MMPHVVVLYNEPTLPADHPDAESEHDILYTADVIAKVLQQAGATVERLGITDDPTRLIDGLKAARPDAVFNLYEGLAQWGNTEAYVSGILELLRIPFTGSPTQPLLLCRSKPLTKQLLSGAGIPTAAFLALDGDEPVPVCPLPWPVIVKPGREDASVGIDQKSVCTTQEELEARVAYLRKTYGPSVLIEQFIRGREFNVALTEAGGTLRALPFSEILFVPPDHAKHLWPIVSFDAKWRPDTLDYTATPAKNPADITPELEAEVTACAMRAFELVGCRDYARVDFRVDESGRIFVLEVNPNPCISPLAGLAAALETAKMPYGKFIVDLLKAALRRSADPELAEHVQYASEVPTVAPIVPASVREVAPIRRIRLRQVRRADATALSRLLLPTECVGSRNRAEFLAYFSDLVSKKSRRGRNILVTTERKEITGLVILAPPDATTETANIEALWIASTHVKTEVGRALLDAVEVQCHSPKSKQLAMHVSSGPAGATTRQQLTLAGFRQVCEWPDYYKDGYARLTFVKVFPPAVPPSPVPMTATQAAG